MNKKTSLGHWTLLDIETTGIDPHYDSIIDVGFLEFEGLKLVRKYSSLVRYTGEISQFILKLTGIKEKDLKNAPSWERVSDELVELSGTSLIAHNASFEKKFLEDFFSENKFDELDEDVSFEDSLLYLALLYPERSQLNLESFIVEMGIAEKELHRGFEDSLDLLKVLLLANWHTFKREDSWVFRERFKRTVREQNLDRWWFSHFFNLTQQELQELAEQIEFDLEDKYFVWQESLLDEQSFNGKPLHGPFLFSKEGMEKIFQDEEGIRTNLPFYSFRDGQLKLALRVGQALKNNIHALVQAPTGTGKTLGYLIPSVLYAKEEKEPILIATGTKALQNQVMSKEVRQVQAILGLDDNFKFVRLMGSSNHFCEMYFHELLKKRLGEIGQTLLLEDDFNRAYAHVFFDLLFYHNNFVEHDKINRSNIPFVLKKLNRDFADLEKELAVDYRHCTAHRCEFREHCSYFSDLQKAKEAQVIVGNHALMMNWPKALPRPTSIIIDEAHRMEQEATSVFTAQLESSALKQLIKQIKTEQGVSALFYLLQKEEGGESLIQAIRESLRVSAISLEDNFLPLNEQIESLFKQNTRFTDVYWNEMPLPERTETNQELSLSILNHLENICFVLKELWEKFQTYSESWDLDKLIETGDITAFSLFKKFFALLEDSYGSLDKCLRHDDDYANVLKYHAEFGFIVEASPINIGEKTYQELLAGARSIVSVSATLANVTGDTGMVGVEWVSGHSYLPAERRFKAGLFIPPVYDYQKMAKVYLCDDTPLFYRQEFVEELLNEVAPLVEELGGRTLFLFSAKTRFERARELLLKKFEGRIPLFIQGMGLQVVEEFKKSPNGILLGMETFGEGLDVPGDALQLVVIDKIPDLRQDLVIEKRRLFYEQNFGNEFNDYFLANRTRSLHQKLGRLLRTEKDRGGAIIVDARTKNWKRFTMERFMKLMNPYQVEKTSLKDACEGIRKFLL